MILTSDGFAIYRNKLVSVYSEKAGLNQLFLPDYPLN